MYVTERHAIEIARCQAVKTSHFDKNLQNATLSNENNLNINRNKSKVYMYVKRLTCCGFRILFVERFHNIIPNLDNL